MSDPEPTARIDYVELPSVTAHELTRRFYAKAFGWRFADYGPDYAATTGGIVDVGLNGQTGEALSAPLPVIRVKDLDAAFDAVVKSGGVIAKAIFAFPGGRRFHFIDPSGSEMAVWSAEGGQSGLRAGPECTAGTRQVSTAPFPSYSAVVGSIIARTCEMLFAGKPAVSACWRINSALGARYMQ